MPIAWDNESVGTERTALQDFTPGLGYTAGRAISQTWADNPVTRMYQWGGNLLDDGEKLDASSIGDLVKAAGVTDFALPGGQYSKETAMALIERHRQAQISADIDARTPYSLAETPVRALARAATMMVDPLNIAAMFVPGLGEEWAAARLAAGAGKFTTGFARGATQGAAGMAALEAVNFPLARALHDDYTSTDALINVLAGAGISGVLHGIGTALRERPTARLGPGPEVTAPPVVPPRPAMEVPPAVRAAPLEVNQAAARTAIAQFVQDQPVAVDHLYDVAPRPDVPPPGANAQTKTFFDDYKQAKEVRRQQDLAYSQMSYDQLEAAHAAGVAENMRIDRDFVRAKLGDAGVAEYDALKTRRGRENFMARVDPEEHTAMSGVDTERIREYQSAHGNFDTESPDLLGRSLLLAAKEMDRPDFVGSPAYTTMRNAFEYAKAQGWNMDAVTAGLRERMVQLYGDDAPEVFERLFRKPNEAGPARGTIADMQRPLLANRARNILDGDGAPPRTEPSVKADAGREVDAKLAEAQTKAQEATQQAEAAVKALREQMAPEAAAAPEAKPAAPAPEIAAADVRIKQAEAEAKAFESIANCQRLA